MIINPINGLNDGQRNYIWSLKTFLFQFSNNELDASDIELDGLFTFKSIHDFDENKVETYVDEVMRVENSEVMFVEYAVQVLFSNEKLGDQRIYCEAALEQAPFGTNANYRSKILVSTTTGIYHYKDASYYI